MARTIAQIRKDLKNIQKDLAAYEQKDRRDINVVREKVRERVLRGEEIQSRDELGILLKKEYEIEREQDEVLITADMILQGKDPKSPSFQHELELQLIKLDLEFFQQQQNDAYRNSIRERVKAGDTVPKVDVIGHLFMQEFRHEQALEELEKEAAAAKQQEKLQENSQEKEPEKQPQMSVQEKKERERQEREQKRNHDYAVEFAGKELIPEIRGCGDPKRLKAYLDKATMLSAQAREHLENRIFANAKIQAYEESRAIKQKNRPPAVKYKDGTILLKNKKRDVPKQTSRNGCWSAVLSDMLNHFGADFSQEEIRAYRPDLNANANQNNAKKLMERLNNDEMNEIHDMADLIQRTVPNVAHHHMSMSAENEANKTLLKETVTDALLNKNSPVAVLYDNHYLSIVGIKDNTLIVQNSDTRYHSKYQKLSIDDLFEGCKGENARGQVTIDWLEDLKFAKDGTCKNVTEQWKNMGISCNKREFAAGTEPNDMTHVRGNEYYDSSRLISQGVEETIYLPKMSFGRERDLAEAEIEQQKLKNVKDGIMTLDEAKKEELVKDDPEIDHPEMDELSLQDLFEMH